MNRREKIIKLYNAIPDKYKPLHFSTAIDLCLASVKAIQADECCKNCRHWSGYAYAKCTNEKGPIRGTTVPLTFHCIHFKHKEDK